MSSVKSLFDVRKVRTILALASVFGIIFLSWIIIDKDNSIAQQKQKDYVATTYVQIDKDGIKNSRGLLQHEFSACEALDRMRDAKGDFTLIDIKVGPAPGQHHLIIASKVCVLKVDPAKPPVYDAKSIPYEPGTLKKRIAAENDALGLTSPFAIVGVEGNPSCTTIKINNTYY